MPNPLLVMAPEELKTPKTIPFKVGDLVLLSWGSMKTIKNRVRKIIKVHEKSVGSGSYKYTFYNYDVQHLGGTKELNRSQDHYLGFEQYREKLNRNIQHTNKILSKQYKELEKSHKLEADAKKLFKTGV